MQQVRHMRPTAHLQPVRYPLECHRGFRPQSRRQVSPCPYPLSDAGAIPFPSSAAPPIPRAPAVPPGPRRCPAVRNRNKGVPRITHCWCYDNQRDDQMVRGAPANRQLDTPEPAAILGPTKERQMTGSEKYYKTRNRPVYEEHALGRGCRTHQCQRECD